MDSRIYGYARVSTKEQHLDRQLAALTPLVPDKRNIICDKKSGKDFNRQGYLTLKNHLLRSGDTLYIKELDRLGRNYEQTKAEYAELCAKGINIVIIDMPMLSTADKSDLEKKLICGIVFELFSYLAEKERIKIRERCDEGIRLAREQGVRFGRPPVPKPDNWNEVIAEWKMNRITATEAMKRLNLKRNTFYKLVKESKINENAL